jgi:hypothetical protein
VKDAWTRSLAASDRVQVRTKIRNRIAGLGFWHGHSIICPKHIQVLQTEVAVRDMC